MAQHKPKCVIMVAFSTGSVTIQSPKTKPELKAAMKDEEITLQSVSETEVYENPMDQKRAEVAKMKGEYCPIQASYLLKAEEITFYRKDVVFFSISEAHDAPPPLDRTAGGLITTQGQRIQ